MTALLQVPSRAHYESLWQSLPAGLEPSHFQLRSRFLLERVHAGERVLDVGCGEARFTAELARAGAQAVGVDVAEEPLRRALARHPELDLRLVDQAGPWPLEDSSFDVVWAGEVIEHVADTAAWLSEVRRVLRSGGSLVLSTPANGRLALARAALSKRAFAERFHPLSDHLRFYNRDTLTRLLDELRFEQIRVRAAGGPPGARPLLLAHAIRSRF
ncbi:MAG TPA: class I SAM-dependent methyltransferase [Solirubrobacteraceae bacterium]|jgi:2-polyprenyl-3-methyl-5-hydroxy-6-metoxy-1,4-benzoquinol methylase|nr:class I SAM-dependent methyltransferase [Solirubrobacteraceae bacterium]